jgi:hypothetical protein
MDMFVASLQANRTFRTASAAQFRDTLPSPAQRATNECREPIDP